MRVLLALLTTTVVAVAFAASSVGAVQTRTTSEAPTAASYSRAVTRICARALLFDHAHDMGTRADALAVAADIRASTARRLARVVVVPVPRELQPISIRWVASQRRLAAIFARTWVQIYDAIDAADTPDEQAALPERLHELVHAPDSLRAAAGRLELKLHVPDCTGD